MSYYYLFTTLRLLVCFTRLSERRGRAGGRSQARRLAASVFVFVVVDAAQIQQIDYISNIITFVSVLLGLITITVTKQQEQEEQAIMNELPTILLQLQLHNCLLSLYLYEKGFPYSISILSSTSYNSRLLLIHLPLYFHLASGSCTNDKSKHRLVPTTSSTLQLYYYYYYYYYDLCDYLK